jgi:DNA modification methylase
MEFLHTEIGSAKDNQNSAVHNWYKFTAGFSHKFVDEIIRLENLNKKKHSQIFDPFAGCGTTLVSSQKAGITAVGNEGQGFMYDVIRAKLTWNLETKMLGKYLKQIETEVDSDKNKNPKAASVHDLLWTLYEKHQLKQLLLIREAIEKIPDRKYFLFFKLALSQTLHKVSIHPISIPYIVRTKTLSNTISAWNMFSSICMKMIADLLPLSEVRTTSKIYKHDSRQVNRYIDNNQCNVCITSPPYLNNLDYGEISKVHTHFFGTTNSWGEITEKVRKKLVTGSTTHYTDSEFDLDVFKQNEFALINHVQLKYLLKKAETIRKVAKKRSGKKSFDILMLLYFQDMYSVINEIRRVIKRNGTSYLILGDSAPYGQHVPTTKLLGDIALNSGFNSYKIHKIRSRGSKWKSLRFRHSKNLTENVLVLK